MTPDQWRVGDYRGKENPVFTNIIAPGGSDTQTFNVGGGGAWKVSDRTLRKTGSANLSLTTNQAAETPYTFNAPDYLVDITNLVKQNPNADLMVLRGIYPHEQLDANGDYAADQAWRMLAYSWTDVNHDGKLWTDKDHDGVVDKVASAETNIDGDPLIDYKKSEIEKGEYVRFAYNNPSANSYMVQVRDPKARMADGIYLGFYHSVRSPAIPKTNFSIRVDFYTNSDWNWLTTPATATGSFPAKVSVPANTPYGMYQGAITLSRNSDSMVVPVSVAVAATPAQDAAGNLTGVTQFGGTDVANAQSDQLYNNGSVYGASDWAWRAESGNWRFYFYDLLKAPPPGTAFLSDTTWDDAAPYTDLDTLIMGRSENQYQLFGGTAPFGAPYILDTVGKSQNTNIGAGVWTFDTATGGPREVITAPAQEGLQSLVQHQVGWTGDKFEVPFTSKLGSANVTPSNVRQTATANTGAFDVSFRSSVDLDGLSAEAFGLSQPATTTETAHQDDPNDPSTASIKKNLTIEPCLAVDGHDGVPVQRCRSVPALRLQQRRAVHDGRDRRRLDHRDGQRAGQPHPPAGRQLPGLGARFPGHGDASDHAHGGRDPGQRPDGHGRPRGPGARGHQRDAPRHLQQGHDVRPELLRRAAARPEERAERVHGAGAYRSAVSIGLRNNCAVE